VSKPQLKLPNPLENRALEIKKQDAESRTGSKVLPTGRFLGANKGLSRNLTGKEKAQMTIPVGLGGKPTTKITVDCTITSEDLCSKLKELYANDGAMPDFVLYFFNPAKRELLLVGNSLVPFSLWKDAHLGEEANPGGPPVGLGPKFILDRPGKAR